MPVGGLRYGKRARTLLRRPAGILVLLLLVVLLGSCGGTVLPSPPTQAELFQVNTSPDQQRIRAERVDSIARQVPQPIRDSGMLVVGTTGDTPPLAFRADDAMTMIGVEPDLAQLVADVLGLELELRTVEWNEIFGGVERGELDVGFGNITVTAERQERFDMTTYQLENQAWETLETSVIQQISGPADISGMRIGVGAGTKSEQILHQWNAANIDAGRAPAELRNFSDGSAYYRALEAGEIDVVFGPLSILNFHSVTKGGTRIIGVVPGAGDRTAEIGAITQRENGLAYALRDAVNAIIMTGKYQAVLDRWALGEAALAQSRTTAR
jgi:polar amino acid transport system substrate-binding protein